MKPGLFSLLLLLLTLATYSPSASAQNQNEVIWEKVSSDLDFSQVTVHLNPFLSSEMIFFRTALKSLRVSIIKASDFGTTRSTVRTLAKSSHALLAINANFFDEEGRPLGLVISRGILAQPIHKGGNTLSGIFAVYSNSIRIMQRNEFTNAGVQEAVQAGPRLITNGAKVKGLRDPLSYSKRSGLCIDTQGRLILYCVSSGILGVSISQLQDLLLDPKISCYDALNLDGGGSSQLFFDSQLPNAPSGIDEISIQGTDSVPVALALFEVSQ